MKGILPQDTFFICLRRLASQPMTMLLQRGYMRPFDRLKAFRPSVTHRLVSRPFTSPPPPRTTGGTSTDERQKSADAERNYEAKRPYESPFLPHVANAFLTATFGLLVIFGGGSAYNVWYKHSVLNEVEKAFSAGYDPALELYKARDTHHRRPGKTEDDFLHTDSSDLLRPTGHAVVDDNGVGDVQVGDDDLPFVNTASHVKNLDKPLKEQRYVDAILRGDAPEHYFMMLGPKGSGLESTIHVAMERYNADGISVCEAHVDMEVFKMRLGKAINYKFNEDARFSLFHRKDPHDGGPGLDIERGLNKVEKVALRFAKKRNRPLVLVIKNIHLFEDDAKGHERILQLQQKAEAWADSGKFMFYRLFYPNAKPLGVATIVFTSEQIWPYHVLRQQASRMQVVPLSDLDRSQAKEVMRKRREEAGRDPADDPVMDRTFGIVGGRLSYLTKAAKSKNMEFTANRLLKTEKSWLLSQFGLLPWGDNDVLNEQALSINTWLVLKGLVRKRQEQISQLKAEGKEEEIIDLPLPAIPYWECRAAMSRPDLLERLEKLNVISVDVDYNVRPESNLILLAAAEVVEQPGFEEELEVARKMNGIRRGSLSPATKALPKTNNSYLTSYFSRSSS